MAGKNVDDKLRCSFCNKTQNQVKKLIAGPNGAYICDECVGICSEILDEEFLDDDKMDESDAGLDINLLKPKEIKEFLDDYVIGQDDAKKFFQLQFITTTNVFCQEKIWMLNFRRVIFLCLDLQVQVKLFLHRILQGFSMFHLQLQMQQHLQKLVT